MKYNANNCVFKSGFFRAFGIKWIGSKSFALFVMISDVEAKKFKNPITKYQSQWKQVVYLIEPGKTKLSDYTKVLKFGYEKLIGK